MSKESIYLAGWLTTAVVAVVAILGIASGAFRADSVPETPPQVKTEPFAEPQISTVPMTVPELDRTTNAQGVPTTDAQTVSPAIATPTAEPTPIIEYVYSDGSPAPAPSGSIDPVERRYDAYDDDDGNERDDDRYEHDDDKGLGQLLHRVFEREDD